MILHCTKCGIRWAKLWTCDGDDMTEFCPECLTDSFLQESSDFVGYIMNPMTGKIINAITGQPRDEELAETEYVKPRFRVVVGKPERETIEEREARELKSIEAYHESGNRNDYFINIKKQK